MNKPNSHNIVVLTGAGGDLGSGMAKALSEHGYTLALLGRTKTKLQETLSGMTGEGHILVECNLGNSSSIKEAVEIIHKQYGIVDILINNAAHFDNPQKIEDISDDDIKESFRSNLEGPFMLTREIIKIMKGNHMGGKIINIGSTSAFNPYALRSLYQISKKGLEGFTWASAAELKKSGIFVNYLCPGPTEGKRVSDVISKRANNRGTSFQEMEKKFAQINGGNKLLSKEQINQALLLLLDQKIGNITGNTLGIDNYGIYSLSHSSFEENKLSKTQDKKQKSYVYLREGGRTKMFKENILKLSEILPHRIKTLGMSVAILLLGISIGEQLTNSSVHQKSLHELLYDTNPSEIDKQLACKKYGVSMDIFDEEVGNNNYMIFDMVNYEAWRSNIQREHGVDIGEY